MNKTDHLLLYCSDWWEFIKDRVRWYIGCITSGLGDGSGDAIEQTELILIIGIGSCSSLYWAFVLSTRSEWRLCFLTCLWGKISEKENKSQFKLVLQWLVLQACWANNVLNTSDLDRWSTWSFIKVIINLYEASVL